MSVRERLNTAFTPDLRLAWDKKKRVYRPTTREDERRLRHVYHWPWGIEFVEGKAERGHFSVDDLQRTLAIAGYEITYEFQGRESGKV